MAITQRNLGESTTDYFARTGYTGDQFGNVDTVSTFASNPTSPTILSSSSGGEQIQQDLTKLNEVTQPKPTTETVTQTQQQIDAASGKNAQFGYDSKGAANPNPNLGGDNVFSAEDIKAAGFTDPLNEGLGFDATRGVYYVLNDGGAKAQQFLNESRGTQTANAELQTQEDWVLSETKKAYNNIDPLLADTLASISADYQARKAQLEQINNANLNQITTQGYRYGTARYSSGLNTQLISTEERQGIIKLGELASQAQQLVIQAKTAAQTKKFDALNSYMTQLDKVRTAQAEASEKLAKAKVDEDKRIQDSVKAAQDKQKADREEEEYNAENLAYSLYGAELSDEEVATIASVSGVSPQSLIGARQKINLENAKKDATVGDLKEWQQAIAMGAIPEGTKFFDYVAKKGAAGRKPEVDEMGAVGASGIADRDADSVMSGVLNLQDISVKDNYRAKVAAELRKKFNEAKKSGDLLGTMRASAVYDKEVSDTFLQSMEKTQTVVSQIETLQEYFYENKVDGVDATGKKVSTPTGPIVGAFRSKNPWDTKAQVIKAQLNAIVPNLARGVYGEVGVLTDNDIKQYSKTLPTLTSTESIRNAIVYITLSQIKKTIGIKIQNQADGQRDMSGYAGTYEELTKRIDETLASIPGHKQTSTQIPVDEIRTGKDGKQYKKVKGGWIPV